MSSQACNRNQPVKTNGYRWPVVVFFAVVLTATVMLCSCSSDGDDFLDDLFRSPNTEPIRASIKTAVPLAHAAAVSMAAVQGDIGDEVLVSNICDDEGDYPCASLITFPMEPENIPFAFNEGSHAVVAGFWSSPDQAILTVSFIETIAGVPSFEVSDVATFPVKRVEFPHPGYMVVYANADINIVSDPDPDDLTDEQKEAEFRRLELSADDDPDINIALDAWIIEVDSGDALDQFSDDSYTISGGGQYINVTSNGGNTASGVYQLGLAGIRVDSSCSLNPLGGIGLIQELGAATGDAIPLAATALLYFEGGCNGRIHVSLATGNFIASIGSTLEFDLNQP